MLKINKLQILSIALLACSSTIALTAVAAVQLGEASVISQQGQRLKIAVPYGSAPGERVPVLRFTIEELTVPAGFKAPSPRSFTMSQGENRNVVILQSRDVFDAPAVGLTIKVANQTDGTQSYQLNVPATQLAALEAPAAQATNPVKTKYKKRTGYKRKIAVQNDLPPK